eukprot:6172139-Pleurochrysis_carterae.AAC.1
MATPFDGHDDERPGNSTTTQSNSKGLQQLRPAGTAAHCPAGPQRTGRVLVKGDDALRERVRHGARVHVALQRSQLLPVSLRQRVRVGHDGGGRAHGEGDDADADDDHQTDVELL